MHSDKGWNGVVEVRKAGRDCFSHPFPTTERGLPFASVTIEIQWTIVYLGEGFRQSMKWCNLYFYKTTVVVLRRKDCRTGQGVTRREVGSHPAAVTQAGMGKRQQYKKWHAQWCISETRPTELAKDCEARGGRTEREELRRTPGFSLNNWRAGIPPTKLRRTWKKNLFKGRGKSGGPY